MTSTHCRNGHPWTEANTLWHFNKERGKTYRRCAACRVVSQAVFANRHHGTRPHRLTKTCRSGKHAWTPENQVLDKSGNVRCRACRLARRRAKQPHYVRVHCVASGCTRSTTRTRDGSYICPAHRKSPPAWLDRAGVRIVGTQLETVA